MAAALLAGAPGTPAEWGAVAAVALLLGGIIRELLVRAFPGAAGAPKGGGLTQEDKERLQRIEASLQDVRERVHRLDESHAPRRTSGEPVWWCSGARLEPQLAEVHQMLGRLLDEQRQSRGLLSRILTALRLSTRGKDR